MITIDATPLTLNLFRLSGVGQFETSTPRVLTLAPGTYQFGTLYGPNFVFSVTEADTVDYDPSLTFLSGAGTNTLRVNGFVINVDATALSLPSFSLFEIAAGLGEYFDTAAVQPLSLIPGDYLFGTLFGSRFQFSVTGTGTVEYDPGLTFLSGAGTSTLTVHGCQIEIDATALTFDSFSFMDAGSGLTRYFLTDTVQSLILIPGSYRFGTLYHAQFSFSVTGTCTVEYEPVLTFVSGVGTSRLTVHGCNVNIDATALTLPSFSLMDAGSGLTRYFLTNAVQSLILIPGSYKFGTLYHSQFLFSVTGSCTVDYDPGLTFVSGAGTSTLTVHGCRIEIDSTTLTLDSFSLMDSGSGLTCYYPTVRTQTVTLIPGSYRFGTLHGAQFLFSVTGVCTVEYDPSLTFLSGAGTSTLTVIGFLLSVDATRLSPSSFNINDSASGLGEPFPTASHQCITLIPGTYVFACGFSFQFSVNSTGVFEYDLSLGSCVMGHGTQRLRVSCDPTGS